MVDPYLAKCENDVLDHEYAIRLNSELGFTLLCKECTFKYLEELSLENDLEVLNYRIPNTINQYVDLSEFYKMAFKSIQRKISCVY